MRPISRELVYVVEQGTIDIVVFRSPAFYDDDMDVHGMAFVDRNPGGALYLGTLFGHGRQIPIDSHEYWITSHRFREVRQATEEELGLLTLAHGWEFGP